MTRNIIKIAITVMVGFSLFYFVVKETGFEVVVNSISLFLDWRGGLIVLVTAIIMLIGAVRWREVLHYKKERVPLLEMFSYHIKGFTVDFLTPFAFLGGEAVRVFMIEKKVGIKKGAFSSVTDKLIGITTHLLFMTVGIILFVLYGATQHSMLLFYAVAMIFVISCLLFLFYFQAVRKKSFLKLVFRFSSGLSNFFKNNSNGQVAVDIEKDIMSFFTHGKKELTKGFALSVLMNIFFLIRVGLVLYFVTGQFSLMAVMIIYGLVILSMIAPLPAAIGGMDVILGAGFVALGFGLSAGVMAAIILRSADLVTCLVGVVLFLKMSVSSFVQEFSSFLKKGA